MPLSTRPLAGPVVRSVLRHRHGGAVARTAGFNVASAAAAAFTGIIIARTVGPAVRGEYAAVTAWFGVLLLAGELGQSAAVCFYVASDPQRARGYVATSRAMMLVTGAVALVAGLVVAPLLAHGNLQLTSAYRIVFCGSVIAFIGTGYTFSLQATSTRRWNLVRVSQPVLALTLIITARLLDQLTLGTAIGAMLASMTFQLGYAYYLCRRSGLAPGHVEPALIGPLVKCGLAQLGAITPAAVNSFLDQLVLSQLVPAADLGRYAIAASVTTVPIPLVSAIGAVAFPRLAARRGSSASSAGLALTAVAVAAALASAILLPLAASAYWLIPAIFGPGYRAAVPLLWILTPGGVFLACGQVVGDLLRGLGRPGLVGMAQGLTAVCGVILLITLLPVVGVMAAAIASTIAYGMALALMIRWACRPARRARARHRRSRGRAGHQEVLSR
ncbi:MAG TPA: oligosaccharide flippase family protein [Trebonia sp.]|nr:oligosaccharide flippase family protein [Trebonia sp.]